MLSFIFSLKFGQVFDNPKWTVMSMLVFQKMTKFWHKIFLKKSLRIFVKTVIFGSICEIWYHLANLEPRGGWLHFSVDTSARFRLKNFQL